MDGLKLTPMRETIGASILKEIRARICFLIDVGLDYLSLSRATGLLRVRRRGQRIVWLQIGSAWWAWPIFWTGQHPDSIIGRIMTSSLRR